MNTMPYVYPTQPQPSTPSIKLKFPVCACFFVAYLLTYITKFVFVMIRDITLIKLEITAPSIVMDAAIPLLTIAVLFIIIVPLFMKKRGAMLALGCIALPILSLYDVYGSVNDFISVVRLNALAELPKEYVINAVCDISMTILTFLALLVVAILAIESTKLINITFGEGLKKAAVIITAVLLLLALLVNSIYLLGYFKALVEEISKEGLNYLDVILEIIMGDFEHSSVGVSLVLTAFNSITLAASYACLLMLTPSIILLAKWLANPNAKMTVQINTGASEGGFNVIK